MSAALNSRFLSSWSDGTLRWLLSVSAIGALLWAHWASMGRADESRLTDDEWPLGRAAMEIRRLPPTVTDDDLVGIAESLTDFRVLPVSTSSRYESSDEFASSGFGTGLYLGYDRGFVIAADQAVGENGASVDFLMRVNSWSHLRHTLFDSNGPNPNQNTFSFERLRLAFSGHVLSPDLQYFLQFDGTSDRSTQARYHDYFVTYDLGHDAFSCEQNRLGIKFGKWKVPFSRSREESGRRLQFTERATANIFFDLNRSIGVGLYGQLAPAVLPIHFETAVFNGFKTGMTSTNRLNGDLDSKPGWSLRSYTDLCGEFGDDGEPDLSWHVLPALRVGGGLAYTRVDEEGSIEFIRQRGVDSGATLASILPAEVSAYDVWLYTVDAHLKYQGFSIITEYYWRYVTRFNGGSVPSLFDDGYVLQAGYFVLPQTFELHFRWSRIAGDSGTLGLFKQSFDEVGAGFTWFFKGHNAKLQLDATHLNGAPLNSSRLDILPSDIGWLYRTQVQVAF